MERYWLLGLYVVKVLECECGLSLDDLLMIREAERQGTESTNARSPSDSLTNEPFSSVICNQ